MSALKIAVAGASGRMGRMLIEAIQNADDMVLAGALDVPGSPSIGTDAASFLGKPANVAIESDLAKGNGELMSSRVSVFFKDNLMERYEGGNDLPTEQEYLSLIAGSKKGAMPELSDAPTNTTPPSSAK